MQRFLVVGSGSSSVRGHYLATHDHKMLATSDRVVYLVDGQVDQIRRREELDIRAGSITTH